MGCSPWGRKSRTQVNGLKSLHREPGDFPGSPVVKWRRKWQPTPVFLPGESQGWRSLVGRRLWGRAESDMTEVT